MVPRMKPPRSNAHGPEAMTRPSDSALKPVSRRLLSRLRSIAEAVCWGPHGAPGADRLDWLVADAEDFLAHAGPRTRFVIGISLAAVCLLAPLFVGRFRLSKLGLRERVRALAALERSRLSAPLFATKAFLSLLYYEHPEAQREVGFDGACLAPGARV